ncbi:Crp/Fnr family transcriptional regulator [Leptothrix ochracea]|uniref:Crp/Fnr family transcriptional regulator n=1 Tax=Leptothrix ochracea TaxID=735331 RepID=UPI0034E2E161
MPADALAFLDGAQALPRPRRRVSGPPPPPADPTPWEKVFGAPLTAEEWGVLARLAIRREVSAGESVLDRWGIAQHLVVLLRGDVVLGSRVMDGELRTERTLTGPAWLDLSSAWLAEPHAMEAQALSDVTVAELPLDALRLQLAAHASLSARLCVCLAQQIGVLTGASRNLLHNDASARFAQWLLQRCPPSESLTCEVRLQERKRDIAQQLAMTPETLSRLIRNLEQRGLISMQGYTVRIQNRSQLQRCAGATR